MPTVLFAALMVVLCLFSAAEAGAQPVSVPDAKQMLPSEARENVERTSELPGHFRVISAARHHGDREQLLTVPHWSGSFSYRGLSYPYTMVGTDPMRGSATTVVPTVMIPMRFDFASGVVFDAAADGLDGTSSVDNIIGSPVFQPHQFRVGVLPVGDTQYADAYQRANFWNTVSVRSPDYHVLLGQPRIAPTIDVPVPNGAASFYFDPGSATTLALIDETLLYNATLDALRRSGVSPQELPIVVWGNVAGRGPSGGMSFGAYHGTIDVAGGIQTYIATAYFPRNASLIFPDTYAISHEVLEWMDDPFAENFTAGWNFAGHTVPHCESTILSWRDLLEVADPLEEDASAAIPVATSNGLYHVAEAVFIDYFTRDSRSRSAGGQYSFFNLVTAPAPPCTCHIEIEPTLLPLPAGGAWMHAIGINNAGVVTGVYGDTSFRRHGFIYDGSTLQKLDNPGAVHTIARRINEVGQVLGYYFDTSFYPHGFVYSGGAYTPVNFPGSADTIPRDFNAHGDIVGLYDATQPVTRGFVFKNGGYTSVDTPFAPQTDATSIDDAGNIRGYAYDDTFWPTAFSLEGGTFARVVYPFASATMPWFLNNMGDSGGQFIDLVLGRFAGAFVGSFVTIGGTPYQVYANVWGMNDQGQIVGDTYDSAGRNVAFVATLPKAKK